MNYYEDNEIIYGDLNLDKNKKIKDVQNPKKPMKIFTYSRINHFKEFLNEMQAKNTNKVPDNIIEYVKKDLEGKEVNTLFVQQSLKKKNLYKYYEHVPHIKSKIQGKEILPFSADTEKKLTDMFIKINSDYDTIISKHYPTKKSFFSYSYLLYKLCELLGEDQHLDNFSMLPSIEKLIYQDQIWKLFCDEFGWIFISSTNKKN